MIYSSLVPCVCQDQRFRGYSEYSWSQWKKYILTHVETRLRADKAYKFDSSLWLNPGSFPTIYKYVDDQKQQYSKHNQDSNKSQSSGSEAKPPIRPTVLHLKRARVWQTNKRCQYPPGVVESSGAPAANSPLSKTLASAADSPAPVAGATLGFEGEQGGGYDTSSQRAASEFDDADDDEMELRTSNNSPPAFSVYGVGDGAGGGGGSSAAGGGSSAGGVVSKGKGKAKEKREEKTTPPRDRGRDGHARKQLATFQASGLGTLQSQTTAAINSMGSQFKEVFSMLPSMLAAGGAGAAGSSAPATETGEAKAKRQMEITKMMMQFDHQYNEKRMKDQVEKNLLELSK